MNQLMKMAKHIGEIKNNDVKKRQIHLLLASLKAALNGGK